MPQYYVHTTNAAERDINRAADYIEYSLKNPLAADTLLNDTEEALSSLAHMPERFALVPDRLLAALGVRFVQVKSYLAFYIADQEAKTVYVVRFLYGKSDWVSILHHDFIKE